MRILSSEWALPISSPPIRNGAVAIENERIVAVGERSELVAKFPAATVDDLGAAAILPGFVNCHSHLELTAMRGYLDDVENDFLAWLLKLSRIRVDVMTAADIELSTLLGAVEGARAGVTCFGDIGRNGAASISALKACGLRGVVFQETEYVPDNVKAEEGFLKLKEKYLSLKLAETQLIEIGLSPHAPYTVCADLFKKIAEFALAENIKTTIHTAESAIETDFMLRGEGVLAKLWEKSGAPWQAPGVSTIEYLSSLGVLESKPLLAHCVSVDENDLDLIAGSGCAIAHCPKSNAKFGHGIAPLESFLGRKITVGLGSDSVASNNTCDLIEEARFAALLARTHADKTRLMNASEILEIMTLGGARALGLEKTIGSLEAGKQADLAIISLKNFAQMPVFDPAAAIVFASSGRDVVLTMVAGEEIYRRGEMKNINEAEIRQRVAELAQRILT